jgi:hypothetical protein
VLYLVDGSSRRRCSWEMVRVCVCGLGEKFNRGMREDAWYTIGGRESFEISTL